MFGLLVEKILKAVLTWGASSLPTRAGCYTDPEDHNPRMVQEKPEILACM
jgi:hypothetical protein